MKVCNQCKTEKPLSSYNKKSSAKDGHYHTCKPCKASIDKDYRDRNKERLKLNNSLYRKENRSAIAATNRKRYYSCTSEEIEERKRKKREYAKNSSEEVKQRKREYDKAYFASEAGKKVTALSAKKRRAQKLSSEDGTITYQSLEALMTSQDSKCKYCSTDLDLQPKGFVHLDHVIPLSKGGVHSIDNVVWSCAPCNHKKSDKLL